MSQLPTGQTGPTSSVRLRRGVTDDVPRIGIQEGLGYAPVRDLPLAETRNGLAVALARSLGVVADGMQVAARTAEIERRRREQEAEDNERVWRGTGAEQTLQFGPQTLDDIKQGRLSPAEGESASEFADRVVRERLQFPNDEENAEAYRFVYEEARERLSGPIQNAIIARRNADLEQANKLAINAIVAGSAGKSPEELRAAAADINRIDPNIPVETALLTLGTQSMQYAAVQGDRAKFDEAASVMPENSIERLTAQNTLENTIDRQQRQREDAFNTEIAGLYVDLESGNASYEQVRQTIMASRDRIKNDAVIDRELQQLASREREDLANAYRTSLDIENRRLVTEMENDIATKAIDAFNTGGLGTLKDSDLTRTKVVSINGQNVEIEQKITREEAIRVTTERAFAQIDALGLDPEMALDQKIGFLSMNGVAYEPWKQTIETGYVSNIQSLRARTMNGEKVTELPKSVVDGFTLWKKMDASNPQLLAMNGNEESLRFYRLMDVAMKYSAQGDVNRAGIMAATTTGRRAFGSISDEMIRKESDWFTGVENENDIGAEIRDLASLLLGSGFAPDATTAIKEASKQVKASHKKVGGVWVNMTNRNLAPDFEQAADFYLDGWATANGEVNEIDRKDITLYPASGSDYYVWDKRGNNALALVTANDLAIASEQRREQTRREIEAKQADALAESVFQSNLSQPQREAMQLAKTYGRAGVAREKRTVAQINAVGDAIGEIGTAFVTQSWYEKRPGETDRDYRNRTRRTGGLD